MSAAAPPAHDASADASQRHLRIGPRRAWDLSDLREAWQYRELFWTLALRDIKVRYKQTLAGVAWVVMEPVVTAIIFTAVFAGIAGLSFDPPALDAAGNVIPSDKPPAGPYLLGAFAAVTGFGLFKNALLRGSASLVTNNQLVRKIYFPRILMPLSAVTSAVVDWLIGLGLLVLLLIAVNLVAPHTMRFDGTWPGWSVLLWPITVATFLLIGLGLSAATAGLAAIYRDVNKIVPTLIQLVMYATPVMYDLSYAERELPRWAELLYYANPLAGVTAAYRYTSTGMGTVHWGAFAWSVVFGLLCLVAGYALFRRHEKGVADVI